MHSQIETIQSILNKKSNIPDYRFTFGRYKGRLLEYVYKHDKAYLKWLYASGAKLPMRVESFLSEME